MPCLRHLEIEGNSTSKLMNASFLGSCTNLEILNLKDNALADITFLSNYLICIVH